jgi:hypothetical protein
VRNRRAAKLAFGSCRGVSKGFAIQGDSTRRNMGEILTRSSRSGSHEEHSRTMKFLCRLKSNSLNLRVCRGALATKGFAFDSAVGESG